MENIKILIGDSNLNVYKVKLLKGEFFAIILFGLKDSSSFYYNKLQSLESAISIYWFDSQVFLSPKNIKLKLEGYSIVISFKVGDIM